MSFKDKIFMHVKSCDILLNLNWASANNLPQRIQHPGFPTKSILCMYVYITNIICLLFV